MSTIINIGLRAPLVAGFVASSDGTSSSSSRPTAKEVVLPTRTRGGGIPSAKATAIADDAATRSVAQNKKDKTNTIKLVCPLLYSGIDGSDAAAAASSSSSASSLLAISPTAQPQIKITEQPEDQVLSGRSCHVYGVTIQNLYFDSMDVYLEDTDGNRLRSGLVELERSFSTLQLSPQSMPSTVTVTLRTRLRPERMNLMVLVFRLSLRTAANQHIQRTLKAVPVIVCSHITSQRKSGVARLRDFYEQKLKGAEATVTTKTAAEASTMAVEALTTPLMTPTATIGGGGVKRKAAAAASAAVTAADNDDWFDSYDLDVDNSTSPSSSLSSSPSPPPEEVEAEAEAEAEATTATAATTAAEAAATAPTLSDATTSPTASTLAAVAAAARDGVYVAIADGDAAPTPTALLQTPVFECNVDNCKFSYESEAALLAHRRSKHPNTSSSASSSAGYRKRAKIAAAVARREAAQAKRLATSEARRAEAQTNDNNHTSNMINNNNNNNNNDIGNNNNNNNNNNVVTFSSPPSVPLLPSSIPSLSPLPAAAIAELGPAAAYVNDLIRAIHVRDAAIHDMRVAIDERDRLLLLLSAELQRFKATIGGALGAGLHGFVPLQQQPPFYTNNNMNNMNNMMQPSSSNVHFSSVSTFQPMGFSTRK